MRWGYDVMEKNPKGINAKRITDSTQTARSSFLGRLRFYGPRTAEQFYGSKTIEKPAYRLIL